MIARSKQAVQTDGRTESGLFARNRQDLTRVLVSYRTFSQRWAFRPELRAALDVMQAEGAMPEGASLRQVAAALEARGVRASQGGARWSAAQVRRVLAQGA